MYSGSTGVQTLATTQSSLTAKYHTGDLEVLTGADAGKHLLFFSQDSGANFGGAVMTLGAASFAVTGATTLLTGHRGANEGNHPAFWDKTGENAILATFNKATSGGFTEGERLGVMAVSISGTTLTPGSNTSVNDSDRINYSDPEVNMEMRCDMAYSSHANKGFIVYLKYSGSTPYNNSASGFFYKTVTSDSSRNITLGSETQLVSGTALGGLGGTDNPNAPQNGISFDISEDGTKFAFAINRVAGTSSRANTTPLVYSTGTISTSGVLENIQSLTTISGEAKKFGIVAIPEQNDKFALFYVSANNDIHTTNPNNHSNISTSTMNQGYLTVAANGSVSTSSFTTATIGPVMTVQYAISKNRRYMVMGRSQFAQSRNLYGGTLNMNWGSTSDEWVGINTAAVSDGDTATITLPGGTNSNQSGMTIEGTYYVQDDGDIETGATTEIAGVAVSATQLLVADNTANSQANIPLSSYATTAVVNAKAPLASPTFTGVPVSTTPATSDNSTKIATTAHVAAKVGELIGAPAAAHTVSSTAAVTEGHAVLLEANGEVTKIGAASAYSQQLISAAGSALSTDSSTAVSNNTGYTSAKIIYYPGQSSFLIARSGDFAKAVLSGGDTTLTVSMVTSGASLNSETSWAYDNTNGVVWMASTGTSFDVQKITMSGSTITTGSAISMGTSQNHYSTSSPRHILETSTGLMCSIYLTDDTSPTLKVVAFKEDGGTFTKGSQHTLQAGSAALFNDTSATGLKWVAKYDSTTGYVVLVRDGGTGNGIVAQTFKVNADLTITDGASSTVQSATTVWANSYGTNTTIGGGLYRYNMSEFNTQSKCAVFGTASNTTGSVGTFVLTVASDGTCTGGSALVYAYGGNVSSGSSTWSQIWTTNYPSTPWSVQLVGDSTVVLVDESRRYQNHYWPTGSSAAYNWNAVPVTRLQEFSISGTTITRTSKYELAGNNTNPGPNSSTHSTTQRHSDPVSDIVAIPNSSKVLYLAGNMYTQDYEVNTFGNHSNYATAAQKYQQPFLWQTTAVANNASNWKGVAASNGAVGATINVVYPRGMLTTSGLTVGSTYYVQNDGSLGTTDTGRKAGYAVTTTKLLVGDNTPLATVGLSELKTVVSSSSDFADFKAKIALL
jgi:hypothetical protein